jgi:hypothetical protein
MKAAIHTNPHPRGQRGIDHIRVGDFIIADLSPFPTAGELRRKFACLVQNRASILELGRQAENRASTTSSPFEDWFKNTDPFDFNDFDGSNPTVD